MNNAEQSHSPSPERTIALIGPQRYSEQRDEPALNRLDMMFSVLKETERSHWTVSAPENAQVIVVSHRIDPERTAEWKRSGKLIVVVAPDIHTDIDAELLPAHVFVSPFRAAEVLSLLGRLEQQLRASSGPNESMDASGNTWAFVETLRTMREVQNTEGWVTGRDGRTPLLWLKADGSQYAADPSIVHAIRRGALDLGWLSLQQGSPPLDAEAVRAGIELAWFAGFHASAHLAPWLSLEKRYRLTTRLDYDLIRPSHSQVRACDILAETASDLAELAACSHISAEESIRTLNALSACDLLALADSPPTSAQQIAAALTSGLSAVVRTSAHFLDAGTSALARRKRSS